jgi:hypothetical protein
VADRTARNSSTWLRHGRYRAGARSLFDRSSAEAPETLERTIARETRNALRVVEMTRDFLVVHLSGA